MLNRSLSVPHVHVGDTKTKTKTKTKRLLTRRCGKGHSAVREEAELGPDVPELTAGMVWGSPHH